MVQLSLTTPIEEICRREGGTSERNLNFPSPHPRARQVNPSLQNEYVQHAFYILYIERFDFSPPVLSVRLENQRSHRKRVSALNVPTRLFRSTQS